MKTSTRVLLAAAVLGLALLLWLGNLMLAVDGRPGPIVREPVRTSRPVPTPAPPPTVVPEPAPRVALPRPRELPSEPAPSERPVKLAELGVLQDRREQLPDDAEWAAAGIQLGLATVSDAIEQCLSDWSEALPELEGSVMVGFEIDQDGLQEAWIEDVDAVPEGPLDCFGDAVHSLDWAGVTENPLQITTRFEIADGP